MSSSMRINSMASRHEALVLLIAVNPEENSHILPSFVQLSLVSVILPAPACPLHHVLVTSFKATLISNSPVSGSEVSGLQFPSYFEGIVGIYP